ncbi:hypothetical protein NXS19_001805 [Fusarium pseudograminearum]|nr:hypothetical protein NXS19_001805 [Fusarium pseudograminearum]
MNWILCLVDTLCDFHSKNQSHGYIKPSTIFFTNQNHVFYSDSTRLTPDNVILHTDKSSFDRERYDYAAPELWSRPAGATSPSHRYPSSDEGHFGMIQTYDPNGSPNTMFIAPSPQYSGQQADIFSVGCIILELLSYLVKRTSSKFAGFRSAKHKTAGRGGAVLDTSFHKNLGQVELWMSGLAKDATRKSTSTKDGANILKGVHPMLHVVTGMLAMNPYDRPPAIEVQQRVYQILTDICNISEPHCVHQYSQDLEASFGGLQIHPMGDGTVGSLPGGSNTTYGTPRTYQHSRNGSSGGYSQVSRTTGSSETDMEAIHQVGSVGLHQVRTQNSATQRGIFTIRRSVAILGRSMGQPHCMRRMSNCDERVGCSFLLGSDAKHNSLLGPTDVGYIVRISRTRIEFIFLRQGLACLDLNSFTC